MICYVFVLIYREILKIKWDGKSCIKAPNSSTIYWSVFYHWWKRFPLIGNGWLIGDEHPFLLPLKEWFYERYPNITNIGGVSLDRSDILWDICDSASAVILHGRSKFIICQAVLEHVKDPVSAVKNLADCLTDGGMLYLHSHGPAFEEHRFPVDCYRFFRDGVLALAELSGLNILDILWTPNHWFLLLRK